MHSFTRKLVKVAMFSAIALAAIPVVAPAVRSEGSALKAATLECHDYKYYSSNGEETSCFDTSAANCTICHN